MTDARITGGSVYAHLFENPRAGVARDLYWAVSFATEIAGQEASVAIDWLTFDPAVAPLDGHVRASATDQPMAEASAYVVSHEWIDDWSLEIGPGADGLMVRPNVEAHFEMPDGSVEAARLDGEVVLPFEGIIVVKDNLPEKPATGAEALAVAAPFTGMRALAARDEGFRIVLVPEET